MAAKANQGRAAAEEEKAPVSTRSKRITKDNKPAAGQRAGAGRKSAGGDEDAEESLVSMIVHNLKDLSHLCHTQLNWPDEYGL